MDFERYAYHKKPSCKDYEFYSEGPKGRILKIVRFQPAGFHGITCYNLALGDWNEQLGAINYKIITNNGDTIKVLATVAAIAEDFMSFNPEFIVYVEGANGARSRLYQMGINKIWDEIKGIYEVYGDTGEELEFFRKNIRYVAFFIKRTENITLQEPNEYYMPLAGKSRRRIEIEPLNEFIIIDQPTCEFEVRKLETMRRNLERSGIPKELADKVRKEQKGLFMIYNDEPTDEMEARKREVARTRLEALGLSDELIKRFRKYHGIIQD